MNIHEYQAKALLSEFGVPISKGVPVLKAADAEAAAKTLPGPVWVVKSQIHAGAARNRTLPLRGFGIQYSRDFTSPDQARSSCRRQ